MDHDGQRDHQQSTHLAEIIRRRRLEIGLSQEQLAERVSSADDVVRQSDISNLERGKVQLPRRSRLERIAAALDLSLGQLLAQSGWAEADRYLAASLVGVMPVVTVNESSQYDAAPPTGRWWHDGAEAVRIISGRLTHDQIDAVIDAYRNAVVWMATGAVGFRGFLLLVNQQEYEVVSLSFWTTEAAMLNSLTGTFLPQRLAPFREHLAAPVSIEHHRLLRQVARPSETREGRLAQIDSATQRATDASAVVQQFHQHVDALCDHDPRLDRAALTVEPGSGRATAVAIWDEPASEAVREYAVAHPTDVRFPQLVRPATSRHFVIALDI